MDLAEEGRAMSLVTALIVLLFVGFVATGVIGFLGWRERMRQAQGPAPTSLRLASRSTPQHVGER